MKCISSPALDDTQIARYIEGEADEAVIAHIRECDYCRERASEWSLLRNGLQKQLYRIHCPTSMELGEYHLNYLADPQKLVVAQHVRSCSLCRQEMAELDSFLADLAQESSLLNTAKVLAAQPMGGQAENGLAPALRGEAKGPLTFEVNGFVIVLDIQPTKESSFNLLGQVAADDPDKWTGAVVELRQSDQLQTLSMIDDLGAFTAEGILNGKQELRITPRDNSQIVVLTFTVET